MHEWKKNSLWKKLLLCVWIIVRGCGDGSIVMAGFLNSGRLYKQGKKEEIGERKWRLLKSPKNNSITFITAVLLEGYFRALARPNVNMWIDHSGSSQPWQDELQVQALWSIATQPLPFLVEFITLRPKKSKWYHLCYHQSVRLFRFCTFSSNYSQSN